VIAAVLDSQEPELRSVDKFVEWLRMEQRMDSGTPSNALSHLKVGTLSLSPQRMNTFQFQEFKFTLQL
jgi:hypothetical protein